MKESNHMDNLFSSKLKDHSPKAPKHIWDRLDAALPGQAKKKTPPVAWYYAAASIVLLIAFGITAYVHQPNLSAQQGLALPADTAKLPLQTKPDVAEFLAMDKENEPEHKADKVIEKTPEIHAPKLKPTKRAAIPRQTQPGRELIAASTREQDPMPSTPPAENAQPELIAKEDSQPSAAPGKVIIEIRSAYQEKELLASNESATAETKPEHKKGKVLKFLKKLNDIKNGDEEIELDEIKQNLFALVPRNERTNDNQNKQ